MCSHFPINQLRHRAQFLFSQLPGSRTLVQVRQGLLLRLDFIDIPPFLTSGAEKVPLGKDLGTAADTPKDRRRCLKILFPHGFPKQNRSALSFS
jgi:hypothetical protein